MPRGRLRMVNNGVDLKRLDLAMQADTRIDPDGVERSETRSAGISIVTIARLIPVKNLRTLVRALASLPGAWHHDLFGDGALHSEIQSLVEEVGLQDRVRLRGLIDRDSLYMNLWRHRGGLYLSASFLEGLPVSVLEAAAAGRVPVLSDIPSHRAILPPGHEELLFDPHSVTACADAVRRVLALSTAEREAMSTRIASHVRQNFSLSAMHSAYDAVYAELIIALPARPA